MGIVLNQLTYRIGKKKLNKRRRLPTTFFTCQVSLDPPPAGTVPPSLHSIIIIIKKINMSFINFYKYIILFLITISMSNCKKSETEICIETERSIIKFDMFKQNGVRHNTGH